MTYAKTVGELKAFLKEHDNADDNTPIIWSVRPRGLFRTKKKQECSMTYNYRSLKDNSKYGVALGQLQMAFDIAVQQGKLFAVDGENTINSWANLMANKNFSSLSDLLLAEEKKLNAEISDMQNDIKYTDSYKKEQIEIKKLKFYNNEEYKFMKCLIDIQKSTEYRKRLKHFQGREYSVIYITI